MNKQIKRTSLAGVLAAMSAILYMFPTFPVLPAFPWLEIDFADVPALFAAVTLNPVLGGVIVLIRNTIHLLVSSTGMVGELSNFIISSIFVMCLGFASRGFKNGTSPLNFKRLVAASVFGVIIQNITAILCNRFIMIPMYGIQGDPITYILAGVVPFNAVKTVVSCCIFILLYKALIPKIKNLL